MLEGCEEGGGVVVATVEANSGLGELRPTRGMRGCKFAAPAPCLAVRRIPQYWISASYCAASQQRLQTCAPVEALEHFTFHPRVQQEVIKRDLAGIVGVERLEGLAEVLDFRVRAFLSRHHPWVLVPRACPDSCISGAHPSHSGFDLVSLHPVGRYSVC